MMSFDKDALLGKWKEVSTLAQKTFQEKISAADLEKVKGNVNMMVSLVESKLGISREEAQKKVEDLLGKIQQSELKNKAEATAGKVIEKLQQADLKNKAEVTAGKMFETANVLLDVVKDKIKKK